MLNAKGMRKNKKMDANAESELSAYTDDDFRMKIVSEASRGERRKASAVSGSKLVYACMSLVILVCVAAAISLAVIGSESGSGKTSDFVQGSGSDLTENEKILFLNGNGTLYGSDARQALNEIVGSFDFVTDTLMASASVADDGNPYYSSTVLCDGEDGPYRVTFLIVPSGTDYRPYALQYAYSESLFGETLRYNVEFEDLSYTDDGEYVDAYSARGEGLFVTETESVYINFAGLKDVSTDFSIANVLTELIAKAQP